jgi:hypothetical protein
MAVGGYADHQHLHKWEPKAGALEVFRPPPWGVICDADVVVSSATYVLADAAAGRILEQGKSTQPDQRQFDVNFWNSTDTRQDAIESMAHVAFLHAPWHLRLPMLDLLDMTHLLHAWKHDMESSSCFVNRSLKVKDGRTKEIYMGPLLIIMAAALDDREDPCVLWLGWRHAGPILEAAFILQVQ